MWLYVLLKNGAPWVTAYEPLHNRGELRLRASGGPRAKVTRPLNGPRLAGAPADVGVQVARPSSTNLRRSPWQRTYGWRSDSATCDGRGLPHRCGCWRAAADLTLDAKTFADHARALLG